MRLSGVVSWGAFMLAGAVDARPAEKKKSDECTPNAACKKIKNVLGDKAAAACSVYLGPRSTTVTVTETTVQTSRWTTQLPQQTESATVDRTTTLLQTYEITRYSDDPTATITGTVVTGVASTTTVYSYVPPVKRAAVSIDPVLLDLEKRHPKSFVSAACSCVYKPTTSTVTSTANVVQYTTQATTNPAPPPVTVTATRDVTVTEQVVITATVGPTSTVTAEVFTSVAPAVVVVVKPAICNRLGLPGPNAFNYDANFNTNQADCISSCKTDSRCYSTGFYIVSSPVGSGQASTGTCRKYDKPVADSASLGLGYYNFNDKACPVPAPTP